MAGVFGVLCHHTGGSRPGNMPALGLLQRGRDKLPGPLAQLGLGRDGTYYVIAAGKANHGGPGSWKGVSGNHHFIGIEAMHSGRRDEPWPPIQLDAYHRGVAAILMRLGLSADRCAGHKEYAQPPGRKVDPNFDMAGFRNAVRDIMAGKTKARELIAAAEPTGLCRRTLRRGVRDLLVTQLRAQLGLPVGDLFDKKTEATVRAFQREHDLVPDGIVGPKTWPVLDKARGQA